MCILILKKKNPLIIIGVTFDDGTEVAGYEKKQKNYKIRKGKGTGASYKR